MNKYTKKIKKNKRGGSTYKRGRSRSRSKSFNTTQSHTLDFLTIFEKTIQARYIEMREKKDDEIDYEGKNSRYWFYVPLDKKVNNIGNIQGKFEFLKEILELKIESPFLKENKKKLYMYEGTSHDYYVLDEDYVMEIAKRLLSIKKNIPTRKFTKRYINFFGNEYLLREENPEQDNEDNKPIVPGRGRQRRRGRGRGY